MFVGKNLVKIVVLGTGGTIAGEGLDPENRPENDRAYTAAQRPVAALLKGVALPAGAEIITEQVAQLDSKDMDNATWRQLLARCRHWLAQDVAGIVITHGTDTLEETAFFLSQTLPANQPVVLTCAMRPATSLEADGPQNLTDALRLVLEPQARGVLAVCAGQAHGALDVQKVHASRLNAFASAAGPVALCENGAWVWQANPSSSQDQSDKDAIEKRAQACLTSLDWPRVEVVMSHAGATGAVVDALLSASGAAPLKGLVVAATGNLTVQATLQAALARAAQQGVAVRLATRCVWGGVMPSQADASSAMGPFNPLSPVKARIALTLELMLAWRA